MEAIALAVRERVLHWQTVDRTSYVRARAHEPKLTQSELRQPELSRVRRHVTEFRFRLGSGAAAGFRPAPRKYTERTKLLWSKTDTRNDMIMRSRA